MEENNGGEKVNTSILYLFLETIRKVENVNEENREKNEENCYKTSKIILLALSNLEKTWKRVRWEKKRQCWHPATRKVLFPNRFFQMLMECKWVSKKKRKRDHEGEEQMDTRISMGNEKQFTTFRALKEERSIARYQPGIWRKAKSLMKQEAMNSVAFLNWKALKKGSNYTVVSSKKKNAFYDALQDTYASKPPRAKAQLCFLMRKGVLIPERVISTAQQGQHPIAL